MAVEAGVRAARLQIDDDDGAACAGIGDERRRAIGVEADIVQVAALQGDVFAEMDDLGDLVGRELDAHQLRSAGNDLVDAGRGRIEDPEIAPVVGHHRLYAHEVVTGRGGGAAGIAPRIPSLVRIGLQRSVGRHFGNRDRTVLGPAREVDENTTVC